MTSTPQLAISFPRPIQALHQIEITSRCNLKCIYCPNSEITNGTYPNRKAEDISSEHFLKALDWAEHFVRAGTQHELNLAGTGESTLHSQFAECISSARERLGRFCKLIVATNGLIVTPRLVESFVKHDVHVWVSLHRPERAAHAIKAYRQAGVLKGISVDPSTNPNDWAGQVRWLSYATLPCQWLREGKAFVMSDGRITTCCLDVGGIGAVGHVDDPIGSLSLAPYALCEKCNQEINVRDYDQYKVRS